MPTLVEQMTDYINAAFAGLWIVTCEPDEAEREILARCPLGRPGCGRRAGPAKG
jgi:hypothetical protein